jgi:hypothetical protein
MSSALGSLAFALGVACAITACGHRDDVWETRAVLTQSHGLTDAVALVDDGAHRVVVAVPAGAGGGLTTASIAVGHNVSRTAVSEDRSALFVLSSGDQPRRSEQDERPSLHVITRSNGTTSDRSVSLASALSGMTLDPLGRYFALHAATSADVNLDSRTASRPFIENPNEVIVIDLQSVDPADPGGAPRAIARTLRSFGGKPQRFTFTPVLSLPGGPRRLLLVETEQDVAILDLDHIADTPERPEITVRLGSGNTSEVLPPAGLVIDDGDPDRNDDARIAIRIANDPSLVTLTLGPATPSTAGATAPPNPNDFSPTLNLVDVGGPATDVAFVRTDGGLRVAAIVPTISSAVLVEPDTSLTERVTLPSAYEKVSLVTRELAAGASTAPSATTDVALLWGGSNSAAGVAFWSLGKTSGRPYRSVEVIGVGGTVTAVRDVPPPRPELKVLELGGSSSSGSRSTTSGTSNFAILDLRQRTAAPLLASANTVTLEVAADGERAWAFQPGSTSLASIALANAHPVSFQTERAIDAVYDVAGSSGAGARALIAVHKNGATGLTLFDALAPDSAHAIAYSGLLLEGLP